MSLLTLWLPILLSTVTCFILSSIIWMALPIHKKDYNDPGEKEGPMLDAIRSAALAPGAYFFPWCSGGNQKDPAYIEKMKKGPWAMVYLMSGAPRMGKMLGLWFAHLLIASALIGYVGSSSALASGASFGAVFRLIFTASILVHAGYSMPMCIWHGVPWKQLPGRLFDGAAYSLATGALFALLWPAAST